MGQPNPWTTLRDARGQCLVRRPVRPQSVEIHVAPSDRPLAWKRQPGAVCVELAEDDVARSVVVEQTVRPVVRHSAHVDILARLNVCANA